MRHLEYMKSKFKELEEKSKEQKVKYLSGKNKEEQDMVNHPDHYNTGKIEVIDAIQDWGLDFIEGNVVKYVARSRHKSSRVGDLKKARWYLDKLIEVHDES